MPFNDYHFLTTWRVPGGLQDVYDVLISGQEFVRWWPEVYLEVVETNPGVEHGLRKAADLLTKGKLPYRIRWSMRIVDVNYPHGFTLDATGDFVGRGVWRFVEAAGEVEIQYDWRLRAEKPLLRYLSPLLKPVFAANHRWAMARGEEGLRRELLRRAERSSSDRRD